MADGSLAPPPVASPRTGVTVLPERVLDAREIAAICRRRLRDILAVTAAVMLMFATGLLVVEPRYTATALLLVDPSQQALLTPDAPGSAPRPGAEGARVESEVEIARSKATLLAAIDRLALASDPEFGAGPTLPDKLRAALGLPAGPLPSGRVLLDSTLDRLARALAVRRRGLTQVFEISVTAREPERAARIANAVAEAYLEGQIAARTRVVEHARELLRAEVARARQRLADANAAFDAFLAENVELLVSDAGRGDVRALDAALAELAARQRSVGESLAAAQRAAGAGDWQALPERLSDAALAALIDKREAFRRQLSRTPPDSPAMADLRRVIASLDERIEAETDAALQDMRAELAEIERRKGEIGAELRQAVLGGALSSTALARLHELRQEAGIAREQHAALLARQRALEAQAPIQVADARIVSPALAPGSPSFPDRGLVLSVGALVAAGLGFGFALMRELWFGAIVSPAQLESAVARPLAAVIPRHGGREPPADAVVTAPQAPCAEGVRGLRAAIDRHLPAGRPGGRVVMLASAAPGEGKSTLALALARAEAQIGRRVIVVDADLRRPHLAALLGATPLYGLADYLAEPDIEPEGDGFLIPDPLSEASVVVGRPWREGPTDRLILSPAFATVMRHLRSIADLVVIDTPPLLAVVDAEILANHADAAVLVTRHGRTAQADARMAAARLASAMGSEKPLLPVLNACGRGDAAYGLPPSGLPGWAGY
ncbi:Uncharacterized protein involved in exopolysaccharide biosynthesis [Meinhardsimonia xiamenensis]|uniref:Uncharacterized protein involved in exopolysaccharide biosynthesis n=1 Tax=Meinhardsimonia xiamenensis TaxID=990712 RepID=A0A1G9F612_9RHOB|nr:GNVR domain-containing protein [Meinhardsimonia xiamenensis]PRX37977.1 uncharacterized protein involved in exopolysaccharide biosynthesis [Meinhardsimonia xiamenensis]SDK83785.1 Uncharacterized protein involved in exopolysaccharide biosynthesis [Meinhardsimonia xiamenensis]